MSSRARLPERLAGKVISEFLEWRYRRRWTSPSRLIPSSASIAQICSFLERSGVTAGSTLFVHSSWRHITVDSFTAPELIRALRGMLGASGTLAMPAFPPYSLQKNGTVFDVRKTPSGGGWLTDCFRRMPGVFRSIHLNHSVCASGLLAEYLTREHHLGETAWDAYSPYYRLRQFEDSWIVGLGVGHRLKVATSLHCVESVLRNEVSYYAGLFRGEVSYTFRTADGQVGSHRYRRRTGWIYPPKLAAHYSNKELREDTIGGLEVYAIRARTLIDKAIALGRQGTTMYVWPVPWPWMFNG